ncbi:recombinase family protein [Rothia nasimurium]|uniref:recombinase family protein n=1 Tax=Rothia nasimurium TaxID=85336 RepID=UPI00162782EB|nr:recombinase family protein [Rothia nasimurium]
MKIGYIRVSTREQAESINNQRQQLGQHGCEKIFTDTASGMLANRPGLKAALEYAREKDSIVVTRLDRLGRSTVDILRTVQDLDSRGISIEALDTQLDTRTPAGRLVLSVLASMAEFERNLIVERTREGLAHARAQGRVGGRRPKLDKTQQQAVLAAIESGLSESQVAQSFGVSRSTITRIKRANRN